MVTIKEKTAKIWEHKVYINVNIVIIVNLVKTSIGIIEFTEFRESDKSKITEAWIEVNLRILSVTCVLLTLC